MTKSAESFGPVGRLFDYVSLADTSFAFRLGKASATDGLTVYDAEMTSQTWQGIPWRHRLTVIVPEVIQPDRAGLFVIAGGTNDGEAYPNLEMLHGILREAARRVGSITAMIECVPNQPLFDGKVEDEIMAFSFDQFLRGEGDDWPLLLPMVKSAIRGMDAAQAIGRDQAQVAVDYFVVTGASKRGWTTWLTATVDPRVIGIAPIVIDMLNLEAQMARQRRAYGGYSENIHDYTERSLQDRMAEPGGDELARIVDPFFYREHLTMPKLICLGTNDPFWTVDAATLYFDGLPEKKWLHYEANAGHDLGRPTRAVVLTFYHALATGWSLPELTWGLTADGEFEVRWTGSPGTAYLWSAESGNRDFRDAEWERRALEGNGRVSVALSPPDIGWTAHFLEVAFASPWGEPYSLTTEMVVLPETFPHSE